MSWRDDEANKSAAACMSGSNLAGKVEKSSCANHYLADRKDFINVRHHEMIMICALGNTKLVIHLDRTSPRS